MQSIPTGSLSPHQYWDGNFIRKCYTHWNCTNGIGYLQRYDNISVRNLSQQYSVGS